MLLSKRKCAVNKQRSIHATSKWHVTLAGDVLKSSESLHNPTPMQDKGPPKGFLVRKFAKWKGPPVKS